MALKLMKKGYVVKKNKKSPTCSNRQPPLAIARGVGNSVWCAGHRIL